MKKNNSFKFDYQILGQCMVSSKEMSWRWTIVGALKKIGA